MDLPLKWEFPGGKIEENETAHQCILREIKEELNINIEIVHQMNSVQYFYGDLGINLIPFIAKYISGDITLSDHTDFKWLPKDNLASLDWADADVQVLKDFLNLYT